MSKSDNCRACAELALTRISMRFAHQPTPRASSPHRPGLIRTRWLGAELALTRISMRFAHQPTPRASSQPIHGGEVVPGGRAQARHQARRIASLCPSPGVLPLRAHGRRRLATALGASLRSAPGAGSPLPARVSDVYPTRFARPSFGAL